MSSRFFQSTPAKACFRAISSQEEQVSSQAMKPSSRYCPYHDGAVLQIYQDGKSTKVHLCQPCGSLNYVEIFTWTRQEHNGFSHQNPSFIGAILNPKLARVYFLPDANCFLSTISHCLCAKNYIDLMVGSKQPTSVWLSPESAT